MKLYKLLGLLLIPLLVGLFSYKTALGFFNDAETSVGNILAAADSFPSPSPSVKPSASPHNPCSNGHQIISGNGPHSKNIIEVDCQHSSSSAQFNNARIDNEVIIDSKTGDNGSQSNNGNSNVEVEISNSVNH